MQRRPETLFWDVDTQLDFLHPAGKLYVPGAEEVIPQLARLTAGAREHGLPVIATSDDHRMSDPEISLAPDFRTTYPPHCMHGTPGQRKIPETTWPQAERFERDADEASLTPQRLRERLDRTAQAVLILKGSTDAFSNPATAAILDETEPRRIVVYGVALDVCNRIAVEGLWRRGHRDLAVVTDATEAIDPDLGRRLLADWLRWGVALVTTEEVLAGLAQRPSAAMARAEDGGGVSSRVR